jgi:hypothetical protein
MPISAYRSRALLLVIALVATAAMAQAPAKQFFRPQAVTKAKAVLSERPAGVASPVLPVEFNSAEMLALVPGEEVQLFLPNATAHAVVFEHVQSHGGGMESWVGYLKGQGRDKRVILTTGPAGSFGVIDTPEGSFRVVPGPGHDWLVDMTKEQLYLPIPKLENDALFPPLPEKHPSLPTGEATYAFKGSVLKDTCGISRPAPVDIDLMVVATTGLVNNLGAGLLTRLNFLVTRANTSYCDSGVGINLRLVNVTVVNYPDDTAVKSNSQALNAISPLSGSFDSATFGNIETIRTQVKADMVSLLRNGSSFGGSGVAWVEGVSANPNYMYSVVTGCVAGCESVFIHELGHNMGNMHDRATTAWQAGGTTTYSAGAQPYAYGYAFCKSGALTCDPTLTNGTAGACPSANQPECSTTDASNFSDIMAYFQGTTSQTYKFSNPAIMCAASGGDLVNRPCGLSDSLTGVTLTTGSSNTAKSMNTTAAPISAIKTGVANPPGIIQFTNTAFSGAESGGSISFTVSRSNGSGGAVTVAYSMSGGTATAGTDFTASSGTLSWADNDAANKTIIVPVIPDALTEGIESFTVTLSGPTGGATLGNLTSATGQILEPWPPGGTAPAGFSSAVTPTLPWATATDSFEINGVDTVSFKSGAFSASATGNSSTQFTGTFAAATLAFAYRVSSYPGFGFFEFLIDNVVVLSDSGDSGWKSYSTNITAGNHTLEWRYRKTLSFFCANAIPAPPQGAACADRAWIDSVSLPLQGSITQFALTVSNSGGGTVTSSPAGINCGATCTANFNSGQQVTLTAAASAGNAFSGWSGGGCSGTGTCTLTMNAATTVSAAFAASANPPRLGNISTRGQVLTGNDVMIGGFVIGGSASKTVLVRARGPSMIPAGVTNAILDPTMTLVNQATNAIIATNDNWGTASNASAITATGLAPTDSRESAILMSLAPGAYTAVVSGVNNAIGVGIVEVFEIDGPQIPLSNISTRGQVQTGNNVMIGGFVISGTGPQQVLIRARGPSMIPAGVTNAIADPTMTLVDQATNAIIATNDNWTSASNASAITATGLAPTNALESAILTTLQPGAYTVVVSGVNNGTGVGIVEVFAQ